MRISLDNQSYERPCPECGAKLRFTVGEAREGKTVTCSCGHALVVGGSQAATEPDIEALVRKHGFK
jgi:hypothetical protein